jgi:hypothetical protein
MISRFIVSELPVVGARRNRRSIWAALAACLFGAATAFIGMDGFTMVHTKARPGEHGADANITQQVEPQHPAPLSRGSSLIERVMRGNREPAGFPP